MPIVTYPLIEAPRVMFTGIAPPALMQSRLFNPLFVIHVMAAIVNRPGNCEGWFD